MMLWRDICGDKMRAAVGAADVVGLLFGGFWICVSVAFFIARSLLCLCGFFHFAWCFVCVPIAVAGFRKRAKVRHMYT